MKARKMFWLVPILAALAVPAYAGNRDEGSSRFEHRVERQRDRIREGAESGDLTRREVKALRQQQRHIAKLERDFTRDGRLDRYERHTLKHELDKAGRRITHLKQNDRYRDDRGHGHGHRGHSSAHGHGSGYYYTPRYRTQHAPGHHRHQDAPYWSFVLSLSDTW